jgi:hypothetical protein
MPIHQINLFVCEKCGKKDTTCQEVILYDDPVVKLDRPGADEWTYEDIEEDGKTKELLVCPECRKK